MTRAHAMLMFWSLGVIWGSSFVFMKTSSALISPLQIVLLRVLFGLIPVAVYAYWKGLYSWAHVRHIGHFVTMGVVGTIAYYYGFAKGASLLLSGVAGALSGLTPIISFILALTLLAEERATRLKLAGIACGFLGVLLIANPFTVDITQANGEGLLYNVIGSFSVAASFVYARKFLIPLQIPFAAMITYQLALSALILLLITDLDGLGNIWSEPYAATGLVLGLGVLGTGVAFILYYNIIDAFGAVSASSVAYVPPVVALLIGILIVGENVTSMEMAGALLIMAGVALVNWKTPAKTEDN